MRIDYEALLLDQAEARYNHNLDQSVLYDDRDHDDMEAIWAEREELMAELEAARSR